MDSTKFIQGLCTNDVNIVKNNKEYSLATAFLTVKGRILATATMYYYPIKKIESSSSNNTNVNIEDRYILEICDTVKSDLFRHLSLYKLRSKVTIKTVELHSYFSNEMINISNEQTKELTDTNTENNILDDSFSSEIGY